MPVNFNLLAPSGPQNLYAGFAQGQEAAAQNALVQEKAAQEREMNALRRQQLSGQIAGQEEDRAKARRVERASMYRERILRAPTPEAAREIVKMQYADPDFGRMLSQMSTLEQALAEVPDDPAQFETYRQQEAMGIGEWLKSQTPKVVGNAVYLPGEKRFVTAPSQRLMPVLGPDGRPTLVPADQAEGMTPLTAATAKMAGIGASAGGGAAAAAPEGKPMTAVQVAARRDKLGKEFKAAETALQTAQDVLDSVNFVKEEPGLGRATGYTGKYLPSFSEGAAASAETRIANLRGKITALGKAAAASSGAIGAIANQEWKILADQIAVIDETKGEKPLRNQLTLIEEQARGAMERIKDAYERQFGEDFERFPQFSNLSAPKSSFKSKTQPSGAGGKWEVVR